MKRLIEALLLLLAVCFAACDTYEQDAFVPAYVVEAYLVAGAPLPPLRLSQTAPVDAFYRFEDYAVAGATVRIDRLDDTGMVEARYTYVPLAKGVYGPEGTADLVRAGARYALEITVPGASAPIRAETRVPGPFDVLANTADTLAYQATERFTLHATPSHYPGRQAVYVAKVQALDTTYGLTPFYAGLVEDGELEPEEVVENASDIVNEASFDNHPDGTLTMRLPWVAVAFYGPNDVVIDAIDDNLYDFLRSRTSNGTGQLGDLDNLIDHVDGGRGIFGSAVRSTVRIFVRRE